MCSSTSTGTGNSVANSYSPTVTGSNTLTMVETGANIGGTYSETVTGNENYTVDGIYDNGFTDTSERTITGSGTYTRTDTGPGATLLSNSGSYG